MFIYNETPQQRSSACLRLFWLFVDVFQDRDAAGATALHLAARFGCVEVIKWLLSVGGEAEVETNCGAVPAHYCAASGDLTCLKLLMQKAPG